MSTQLEMVEPDDTIKRAAVVMNKHRVGGLLVQKGHELKGIITERDILKAFAKGVKPATAVKEVMTKDVMTVDENSSLEDAAKIMLNYGVKRLPVVSKGRCVGIVTATDLIAYEEHLIDRMSELFLLQRRRQQAG